MATTTAIDPEITRIPVAPAIELAVARFGTGSPLLLVHGFPHTWQIWQEIIPALAAGHRVIAPDLRGFGASTMTDQGLDADVLSRDLETLLVPEDTPATVVAIDAGVAPAFLLALRRPDLVARLVLIEATLGQLPGAESFFSSPPWWFGFHAVPELAERVLAGNEASYVDFFLDVGTRRRPITADLRTIIGSAYAQPDGLRGAMAYYRAMPRSARQLEAAVAEGQRLTVPTLAIGSAPVGEVLARQLAGVTDHLRSTLIAGCGHIVPLDAPLELTQLILGGPPARGITTASPPGQAGDAPTDRA